ncbi:hypothetical protein [Methanococcus maripaludis]|uniref:Disulfide oxidoreductase YuzD n=1 Tax=Methanococcus maripaludis TaxID=39152 RepID=A0A7J9PC81_METMI|nr:hypothetical protein [Methanococcus maripaludis]MBA2860855.1 disulfide oxidoreductase YuzD [Methanococcus maripaludis]
MGPIHIFVENVLQELFFEEGPLNELLKDIYSSLMIYTYGEDTPNETNNWMAACDETCCPYLIIKDTTSSYGLSKCSRLDTDNLVYARIEIESWYLAGLTRNVCTDFNMEYVDTTNNLDKDMFEDMIPNNHKDSKINFMTEILSVYDVNHAKDSNDSFNEFYNNFIENPRI